MMHINASASTKRESSGLGLCRCIRNSTRWHPRPLQRRRELRKENGVSSLTGLGLGGGGGCCCCCWPFLFPWYVCARRLLERHYLIIPPLPLFFLYFFYVFVCPYSGSWSQIGGALAPSAVPDAADVCGRYSSELPCSQLPGMLTLVAVCSMEWP